MGRLFWKFFFFIWLAQLTASIGVGAWFWWEREQDHQRWETYRTEHPGRDISTGLREHLHRPPLPEPPPDGPHHPPRLGVPPPILIAALLASFLFAALLAWYFSKPIQTLRKALTQAAAGELSARPGREMGLRKDELADLGHAFDRMAIQLRAVLEAQKRLLGDVSHELRSPLARIQVAIGLARQQPECIEQTLNRLERESEHMDVLIGELLTLSRLDSGSTQVEEEINLSEVLFSVVEDIRFEWADKPVNLLLPPIPEIALRGDGQLLQRAIENVVRNAVKFAPNNTDIEIKAHTNDIRQCMLQILDQGPGVPQTQLAHIFEPFARCELPDSPPKEGYGLGLAIAQAVINRMGGKISARNRDKNQGGGLCVEIVLPTIN